MSEFPPYARSERRQAVSAVVTQGGGDRQNAESCRMLTAALRCGWSREVAATA